MEKEPEVENYTGIVQGIIDQVIADLVNCSDEKCTHGGHCQCIKHFNSAMAWINGKNKTYVFSLPFIAGIADCNVEIARKGILKRANEAIKTKAERQAIKEAETDSKSFWPELRQYAREQAAGPYRPGDRP